ncbi:LOW QUALITY PROTEIN: phosphatidylinositol-glycan biosynthesis class W protein-like [Pecten maximus]|uniref:LOW QUALITY PROTEIN: phosphatidylinositol-glycan biosynthesis class W protein-like n=1 Tax=Pecten maximus TaxID=6579 RepID=UPI001457F431|nr:LOW QUALITY PROTEIN: phosphatidylinositol-glycan biosynthesis class W protein-like [Pecten maximus]
MSARNASYKELHEQFVSDHVGTTSAEVSAILCATGIAVFSRVCVQTFLWKTTPRFTWYTVAIDHVCLVLPLQLILTVWSEYITLCLLCILVLSLTGVILKLNSRRFKTQWLSWSEIRDRHIDPQLSFINNFRAYVLVYTAISILGVDFSIFPRRFCKAETYGTGVMDTGVGLFVISNAIVSPEARGKYRNPGIRCLVNCLISCLPLLLLGLVRFAVTKGANYHEHVSEYGVHWNFFITLAALKIMSTLFYIYVPEFLWSLCALGVVVVYQYSLDYGGVRDYLLLGEDGQGGREGLINANREGIFSCLGYFALYVFGTEIGKMIFRYERFTMSAWRTLLIVMAVTSMFFWGIYSISALAYGESVSRRFANLTYVLWILALSTQTMSVLLLVDLIVEYLRISAGVTIQTLPTKGLLNAINYNGLFYFLLSNVLTGLVNISMATIHMPPLPSLLILTLYMSSLSAISVHLFVRRVRLKFW